MFHAQEGWAGEEPVPEGDLGTGYEFHRQSVERQR
jgi:hypothetical protein